MRIRLLLATAAAAITLAACGESSTAPQKLSPADRPSADITCRSGYHIATRADGSEYCEGDAEQVMTAAPTTASN
jgi:hypothetical protein